MPETEPDRGRWRRLTHSLSAKLISLLLLVMTGIFALLGYLNIHLHRQHLEAATLTSAERVIVRLRIFDREGHISYSSDTAEVGHVVDKGAEACYGCHAKSQPLVKLN